MAYGMFTTDPNKAAKRRGDAYDITTPLTPMNWSNFLFNDEYHMEVTQTLQGVSSTVDAYRQETVTTGERQFFVLDEESGEAFSPNYVSLRKRPETYHCVHSVNATTLTAGMDGIECRIMVFIPVRGASECWEIRVTNRSDVVRNISVFSAFPLGDGGTMGGACTLEDGVIDMYAYPYHVYYEDHDRVQHRHVCAFAYPEPDSRDMSAQRFWGCADKNEYPVALRNGRCSDIIGEIGEFCAAMQHRFSLSPGQSESVYLRLCVTGTLEEAKVLHRAWNGEAFAKELSASCALWEKRCGQFELETPDENLNAFANAPDKAQSRRRLLPRAQPAAGCHGLRFRGTGGSGRLY